MIWDVYRDLVKDTLTYKCIMVRAGKRMAIYLGQYLLTANISLNTSTSVHITLEVDLRNLCGICPLLSLLPRGVNVVPFLEMIGLPESIVGLLRESSSGYALTAYAMYKVISSRKVNSAIICIEKLLGV